MDKRLALTHLFLFFFLRKLGKLILIVRLYRRIGTPQLAQQVKKAGVCPDYHIHTGRWLANRLFYQGSAGLESRISVTRPSRRASSSRVL